MAVYKVTEDFNTKLWNPKKGDILTQRGDYLYDEHGSLAVQMGSLNQCEKTERIPDISYRIVYVLPKKDADLYQEMLNKNTMDGNYDEDSVIKTLNVQFADDSVADIKICNGDELSGPFIDPVFYDKNGDELALLDPEGTLLQTFVFEVEEGNILKEYCAEIVSEATQN